LVGTTKKNGNERRLVTKDDLEQFKKELLEEIRRFQMYPRKRGEEPRAWLKSYEVRKMLGISAGTLQI
jgi:hypothetical protein